LRADPSQGSHFFHNITTLGITYATVSEDDSDFINWDWLKAQPVANETAYVAHVKLGNPFILKADGRNSRCVMYR